MFAYAWQISHHFSIYHIGVCVDLVKYLWWLFFFGTGSWTWGFTLVAMSPVLLALLFWREDFAFYLDQSGSQSYFTLSTVTEMTGVDIPLSFSSPFSVETGFHKLFCLRWLGTATLSISVFHVSWNDRPPLHPASGWDRVSLTLPTTPSNLSLPSS
jgi:hypothetical protein